MNVTELPEPRITRPAVSDHRGARFDVSFTKSVRGSTLALSITLILTGPSLYL
jgi:hypothetical protein